MFWDGDRWVDEHAYEAARKRSSRPPNRALSQALALGLVVVGLIGLSIPFVGAARGNAQLALTPNAGPAGTITIVRITGLASGARGLLTWDAAAIPGSGFTASGSGTQEMRILIPAASPGGHQVGVATTRGNGRNADRVNTKLTASFTIQAQVAVVGTPAPATPAPATKQPVTDAPEPTAQRTPSPTAAPTQVPTVLPTVVPGPTKAPDPTKEPTPDPTPKPTPDPTPKPTPDPTDPPNGVTGVYGSAMGMDSKNNLYVGGSANQKVSHRFRAGTDGKLKTIAFNQRGGPGYSSGNGGKMEISIQTNDNGKPSGNVLASLTFSPGNPGGHWENHEVLTFADPANLNQGQTYHVVFRNVGSSPGNDYISANEAYQFQMSDQPAFGEEFAVLTNTGSGWSVSPKNTAVMDLGYTNGHHDGNAYYEMTPEYFTEIGGNKMARERFKISGSTRVVTQAWIRIKRHHGSSPLTVRLENANGDVLASDNIPASDIPTSPLWTPGGTDYTVASLSGSKWVKANFGEAVQLKSGETYRLRFSTDGDTLYAALPLRELTNWHSRVFGDGEAERTFGSGWNPVYQWGELDLQFYLY